MSLQTLSLAQVQTIFKNVAKFIFVHQLSGGTVANPGVGTANKYRRALMAALDQAINGGNGEFTYYNEVAVPFAGGMRNIVATLDKLPDQAQAALTSYLLKAVGPALDPAKTYANVAAMQSDLNAAMLACTGGPAVVTASGTNGSNADGIAMWLKSKLGLTVNNGNSPNILDAWITDTVV